MTLLCIQHNTVNQLSKVKYCACPTSELNGWVIFVSKKSNYGLSPNCLRERRTLGMFFFSTFLLSLSFFLMSFFPFLLFYTLLCFLPVRILSPYPYHFLLSSTLFSFPFFHSITTLSAPHMYHFHSIVFLFFFVSFYISCYKYHLIFY